MRVPQKAGKPLIVGAALFYFLNSAGCGYAQPTQAQKAEQKGSKLEETISSEYSGLKEPDKAYIDSFIEFYNKEVEPLDPNYAQGKVLSLMDKHIKKLQEYTLSKLPQKDKEVLSAAFSDYGLAVNKKGDYQSALDFYHKSLELEPSSSVVLCNIGYIHFKRFNDLKTGLKYYKEALETNPKDNVANYYVNKISRLLENNQ